MKVYVVTCTSPAPGSPWYDTSYSVSGVFSDKEEAEQFVNEGLLEVLKEDYKDSYQRYYKEEYPTFEQFLLKKGYTIEKGSITQNGGFVDNDYFSFFEIVEREIVGPEV